MPILHKYVMVTLLGCLPALTPNTFRYVKEKTMVSVPTCNQQNSAKGITAGERRESQESITFFLVENNHCNNLIKSWGTQGENNSVWSKKPALGGCIYTRR